MIPSYTYLYGYMDYIHTKNKKKLSFSQNMSLSKVNNLLPLDLVNFERKFYAEDGRKYRFGQILNTV
jgi:hypothetical protein